MLEDLSLLFLDKIKIHYFGWLESHARNPYGYKLLFNCWRSPIPYTPTIRK
ncbi:MAG: hypothetical protein KME08_11390 [Aphanothece sp. CMT-3BRIN-NPC111]|nr:hypothetical protein [Aphanothece sp. CMT-3BRIN-NPC111]